MPDERLEDSCRFWLIIAATGVVAGGVGIILTVALHSIQHLAFGYTESTFLYGVEQASGARRLVVLSSAGLITGLGWWALRRSSTVVTVDEALDESSRRLPIASTTIDAGLQILAVGMGASLGREGAPRQVSAAVGGWLADHWQLPVAQRKVVIAAGAGAGLAAVYNVPLSGAVFACEILLGSMAPRFIVPAVIASTIATVSSWIALPNKPVYPVGDFHLTLSLLVFALIIGPVVGAIGRGFRWLMQSARRDRGVSWHQLVACPTAFVVLGVLAIGYPELLGNGKGPTQLALTGSLAIGIALVLAVLKPAATALCLRAGARGGLLTPALATGALFGAFAGGIWREFWPAGALAPFVLVAAGATLAVTLKAPICAVVLIMEFTHTTTGLLGPLILAITAAHIASGPNRSLPTGLTRFRVGGAANARHLIRAGQR